MKSGVKYALAFIGLILAAGLSAPYFGADYFRGRIEHTLEADLNRKVTIGKTHFNLFTGPGFTVEDVIIEEDPRIGIEPFAVVSQLDARVDLISLFAGKLKFSSLHLVEPRVNFARGSNGDWNVNLFMSRSPQREKDETRTLPAISIVEGKLFLKFGYRKAVVRLEDAEGDIIQSSDGRIKLSISGEPYRSDRNENGFGRMALRGNYAQGRMDFSFELLKTPIQDFLKMFGGPEMGLKGFLESDARLTGPLDHVSVQGQLKTSELANRLFLPSGGSGSLPYQGIVNFAEPEAEFASKPSDSMPVTTHVAIRNFLKDPDWSADVTMQALAAPAVVEMLRQLGFTLPAGIEVKGLLGGALRFAKGQDTQGDFVLDSPVVKLANGGVVENVPMRIQVTAPGLLLKAQTPDAVVAPRIEVDGKYDLESKSLALDVVSRGVRIGETRKWFGALPLIEQLADGLWRGTVRYAVAGADGEPVWTGTVDVAQARVVVPGISAPALVSFGATVEGAHAVVRNLKGSVGTIEFNGDYRYEPTSPRPHRINLVVPNPVKATELEEIFRPTLARSSGFIARLTRVSIPEWLHGRQLDGTIRFGSLQTGVWTWTPVAATFRWAGPLIQLTRVTTQSEVGSVEGDGVIDLSGALPVYSGTGALTGLPYRSGTLDFKGKLGSRGFSAQLIENTSGEGTFEGADIWFAPEANFERITGAFQFGLGASASGRTKLSGIEAVEAGETYRGKGTLQPDGRLVLELENSGKQQRIIGPLFGSPAGALSGTTPQP